MKKTKIIFLIVAIILMCLSSACNQSGSDIASLTQHEHWYFFDEVIGEHEVMTFKDDHSFSLHCECGEPVGDSDIYEFFDYDPESMTIMLSNEFDESQKNINVLSHNDYHLMVEMDGRIKTYTPEITYTSDYYYGDDSKYISGYEGYCTVFKVSDGKAEVGPFNYDGDIEYPEGTIELIDVADNAVFYELIVNSEIDDSGIISHKESYRQLSSDEVKGILEYSSGNAYLWYNDQLEIEKMMFWGQTIIWN